MAQDGDKSRTRVGILSKSFVEELSDYMSLKNYWSLGPPVLLLNGYRVILG